MDINDDYRVARGRMLETIVHHQMAARQARLDSRVLEVMSKVPRHHFVPPDLVDWAYDDAPLQIGEGQTISQPYIVALMTHMLRPQLPYVILEIGTGSGYQAAVLAHLVRHVYSVERSTTLAQQAERRLRELGITNVEIRVDDGYYGWEEHAPYDGILVTAAAPEVPQPLIDQLKAGGRLVIPVGFPYRTQDLQLLCKDEQDHVKSQSLLAVAFVPLISDHDTLRKSGE